MTHGRSSGRSGPTGFAASSSSPSRRRSSTPRAAWWAPWTPGRVGGLTFGTAARRSCSSSTSLYPFRRRWNAWPFGNVQRWLQFHVYGGALAGLYVLIHVGFHLPHGLFGWWLFLLSFWVILSGLGGVYLQKQIPAVLANNLAVEAIYERIPELTARLQAEADKLLAGAPELLQRFYSTNTRASLAAVTPAWGYSSTSARNASAGWRRSRKWRRICRKGIARSSAICRRLSARNSSSTCRYSLQRLLRVWVPLHAAPASS